MKLPDIERCLENDEEIGINDIKKLVKDEKSSTTNSIISFIKKIRDTLANEDDRKIINKLLLHIEDEFKES
jgi:hypothetical protein